MWSKCFCTIKIGHRSFECNICGKYFSKEPAFERHIKSHTGQPFKCKQCGQCFRRSTALISHTKSHAERSFSNATTVGSVSAEQATFVNTKLCTQETRVTTPKKTKRMVVCIHCNYCGKGFSDVRNQRRHERQHSGKTSTMMEERKTSASVSGNEQQQKGTAKRPFMCKHCSKCFRGW